MALSAAQWNSKIKKFVPAWRFTEAPTEQAFFQAIAALFNAYDNDLDDHFNSTFYTRATTPILDDEGAERSVTRESGELDASYAARIQVIANSNNLTALKAAVDGCLNNGTSVFIENEQYGFMDDAMYCDDPDSLLLDSTKQYNFFTVIIPGQTAGDFAAILASIISALETDKALGVSYDVLCEGGPVGLLSVVMKSAAYPMTIADDVVLGNTNSAGFNITLPDPATTKPYVIKKINPSNRAEVNKITILPHASETIEGLSSYVMTAVNHSVTLVSDGTNWEVQAESFDTRPLPFTCVITGASSNPTKGPANIDRAIYSVNGKKLKMWYTFEGNGVTGGAAGSGIYYFSIPPGYEIDLTASGFFATYGQQINVVGQGAAGTFANNFPNGYVAVFTGDRLLLLVSHGSGTVDYVGDTFCPMSDVEAQYSFECELPIL